MSATVQLIFVLEYCNTSVELNFYITVGVIIGACGTAEPAALLIGACGTAEPAALLIVLGQTSACITQALNTRL